VLFSRKRHCPRLSAWGSGSSHRSATSCCSLKVTCSLPYALAVPCRPRRIRTEFHKSDRDMKQPNICILHVFTDMRSNNLSKTDGNMTTMPIVMEPYRFRINVLFVWVPPARSPPSQTNMTDIWSPCGNEYELTIGLTCSNLVAKFGLRRRPNPASNLLQEWLVQPQICLQSLASAGGQTLHAIWCVRVRPRFGLRLFHLI